MKDKTPASQAPKKTTLTDGNNHNGYFFKNNSLPMWIYDLDTYQFMDVNHAATKHFGYSRKEFLSMTITDFSPQEDMERLQKSLKRKRPSLQNAGAWHILHKDGSLVDVKIYSHTLEYKGRAAALVMALDITEHKRAETALRESEKRLVAAQRIAKTGDFTWDVGTGEITWSKALFELLGYDRSEEIDYARVNAEIHHPDDLQRVTHWLNDCVASGRGELTPNEYRIKRKDGEVIYVRTVGIIEHEVGKSAKVFATVQDITERKRTEVMLHESEERYRLIAENSIDVIWQMDLRLRFTYITPSIYEMTGYTPDE